MSENNYKNIKLVETPVTDTSNLEVMKPQFKVIKMRGKKVSVAVDQLNAASLWLFALLKVNDPVIDEYFTELEIIVFDAEDNEIFNWKKGGWQL